MKKLTNNEYAQMVRTASPKSKSGFMIPMAFLFGGGICVVGQGFINLYIYMGVEEKMASMAGSVTLIFLAALLTGLNVYDDIAKIGGAGTLVPITGFANAVAAPALEFKTEGFILGVGTKLFVTAGPVIVYGISAGVLYGLIIYLFGWY